MKSSILLAVAVSFLVAGCGEKSKSGGQNTNAASSTSPLTAPVDYLGAAAKAQQSAVKTVDVVSLNQAIQMFNVDKGRNPKDLDELVSEKYIPKIPAAPYGTKIEYNATSGKVSVVKQ